MIFSASIMGNIGCQGRMLCCCTGPRLLDSRACGASSSAVNFIRNRFSVQEFLRPPRARASFEFVDESSGPGQAPAFNSDSDPPESLQRIATLAAKWLTRLGANSPDLSRWATDGVDGDGVGDATRQDATDATSTSLLQTGLGRSGPGGHSVHAVATHFGLEGLDLKP